MGLTSGRLAEVALASAIQSGAVLDDTAPTVCAAAHAVDLAQTRDSLHEAVLRLLRNSWLSQVRAYQPLSPDLT
jgi:hypothetical protein